MTTSIKAVDFTLDQKQSDLIGTKVKRIAYAEDLIVDLIISVRHDKEYKVEATVRAGSCFRRRARFCGSS